MQEERKAVDVDSQKIINENKLGHLKNIESKLELYSLKFTLLWGKIFRFVFILAVGIFSYFWLEPKSIGDVPFAQLTVNMIGKNIFGALIPLGCIFWFFNFPEVSKDEMNPDNPYKVWASSSFLLALIAGLYWYFFK